MFLWSIKTIITSIVNAKNCVWVYVCFKKVRQLLGKITVRLKFMPSTELYTYITIGNFLSSLNTLFPWALA